MRRNTPKQEQLLKWIPMHGVLLRNPFGGSRFAVMTADGFLTEIGTGFDWTASVNGLENRNVLRCLGSSLRGPQAKQIALNTPHRSVWIGALQYTR